MTLKAEYYSEDGLVRNLVSLGTISRPPFKLIWNAEKVPNQLFAGIALTADAELRMGGVASARREGIFLLRDAAQPPSLDVPYGSGEALFTDRNTMVLTGPHGKKSAFASVMWGKKELAFFVKVVDPLFYANRPDAALGPLGVEILIDTRSAALPYPTDSLVDIDISLNGRQVRRYYMPASSPDGSSFRLPTRAEEFTGSVDIRKSDVRGWDVSCRIPWTQVSSTTPRTLRCNVIARVESEGGATVSYSWTKGNPLEMRAPVLFGTLSFDRKPTSGSPAVLWLVCFLVGFGASLAVGMALGGRRKERPDPAVRFELSEERRQLIERIKTMVDHRITDRSLTLEKVAGDFGDLRPVEVNALFRKGLGISFQTYVMRARAEVAKERLRSSNSSEASIAEQCGFANPLEMEKTFRRLYRITPYAFRMRQQVT